MLTRTATLGFMLGLLGALTLTHTTGCDEGETCLGQSVAGEGDCDESLGWMITACNECKEIVACSCKGDDCEDLFASEDDCEDEVGGAHCEC